jgi:hypothetical protein
LRPVADGPNQWDMHRSSAFTVGTSSLGSSMDGTESVPGSGSTVRVLQVATLPIPETPFPSAEVYVIRLSVVR